MKFFSSKFIRNILVVSGVVGMMLFTGCETKPTRVNSLDTLPPGQQTAQTTQPDGQRYNPGSPFGTSNGTFSIIVEIKDNTLTVATMPADASPQGTNQPTRPSGTGTMPQGSMPSMPSSPNVNGLDTSNWQKTTWTVDDKTTIVQGQFGGSNTSAASALKLADLKVGDSVTITERAGQTSVAGQITVMQGLGNTQGGGRFPTATTKN